MGNPYNQLTEKERHFKSLEASAEIAEKASLIALERGWDYKKAVNYVTKMDSRLAELQMHGYISETESRDYTYSSHEAATLISEKATALMKAERITYAEAVSKILSDPQNREIGRCYSEND